MKTLKIAEDLKLPLDAITQTFLVVGKRGSGKSNTAARMVEQFHHAKLPFVVLDPVDTWWGLKAGRDGGPGLDVYVFGGQKKDLPLEANGGALIAEVLCEHRISMVLSVKHLSGRERSAFMVAFAQTLFQKWAGGPLHVVLEEAHELAPQMAGGRGANTGDNEAAMLGAFKRLWKLGRSQGIGGTAVTQRPASLSKDITTQSEILVAHRTIGPQDVAAIGQWVKYHGQHEEILGKLPSLPTGEAYIWAPEFPEGEPLGLKRITVLRRDTFDSASTPKVGETRVEPKELAPVDMERLRTKMAATIEKAKADDPRELRKQIAELKKEVETAKRFEVGDRKAGKVDEKPVLTDADRALLEKVVESARHQKAVLDGRIADHVKWLTERMHDAAASFVSGSVRVFESDLIKTIQGLETKGFQKILEKLERVSVTPAPLSKPEHIMRANGQAGRPVSNPSKTVDSVKRSTPVSSADGISPVQQRILNALAELEQLGAAQPPRELVAFMANYTHLQSKGFVNAMSGLSTAGLITYGPGTVTLSDTGRAAARAPEAPRTAREVQERIINMLGGASGRILEPLIEAYPHGMAREDVAARAGYGHLQSKGFVNAISRLRTLGFVDYPDRGSIIAKPVLFLEA